MSGINISPGTIQINGVELSGNQGTQSTNVEPGINVSGETTASNQPQVASYSPKLGFWPNIWIFQLENCLISIISIFQLSIPIRPIH